MIMRGIFPVLLISIIIVLSGCVPGDTRQAKFSDTPTIKATTTFTQSPVPMTTPKPTVSPTITKTATLTLRPPVPTRTATPTEPPYEGTPEDSLGVNIEIFENSQMYFIHSSVSPIVVMNQEQSAKNRFVLEITFGFKSAYKGKIIQFRTMAVECNDLNIYDEPITIGEFWNRGDDGIIHIHNGDIVSINLNSIQKVKKPISQYMYGACRELWESLEPQDASSLQKFKSFFVSGKIDPSWPIDKNGIVDMRSLFTLVQVNFLR